jgi:hypothetical protein
VTTARNRSATPARAISGRYCSTTRCSRSNPR